MWVIFLFKFRSWIVVTSKISTFSSISTFYSLTQSTNMKVILAGLSKTGTKSMAAALRVLGYSVYDVTENFSMLGREWLKVMEEGGTVEDFRRMYESVDATGDIPAAHYWEEILEAFPDAKVRFCNLFILRVFWTLTWWNLMVLLICADQNVGWKKFLSVRVYFPGRFLAALIGKHCGQRS